MWILSARYANTCAGARAHTGAKISTAHPFYWGCGWFHRIGTGPGGGDVGGRPLRNRGGGRPELSPAPSIARNRRRTCRPQSPAAGVSGQPVGVSFPGQRLRAANLNPGTFNQKQPGNKRQTTRKQAKNNRPTRPTPEGGPDPPATGNGPNVRARILRGKSGNGPGALNFPKTPTNEKITARVENLRCGV